MVSFSEKLDRAEKAPPQFRDVDVYLDGGTAARVDELQAQVDALDGDKRLGDMRQRDLEEQIASVEAEAADGLVVLRFRRLPPERWATIIASALPPRDVFADRAYGYNIQAAAVAAAPESGVVLGDAGDDGQRVEETVAADEWARLFELISGRDFSRIVDALFDLNDYGPQQRLDAARKVSRAGGVSTSN